MTMEAYKLSMLINRSILRTVYLIVIACALLPPIASCNSDTGLEDCKEYFIIGASVSPGALKTGEAALILKQFGSLTAENAMN
jgi:hypothetical protein